MHDLVITGGKVIDGTGGPARAADVAIDGGRITAVSGERLGGRRVLDVDGQVVAPGFIDLHTHADFTLQASPAAVTALSQGVTTLVGGNCGHSPFPLTDRNRSLASFAGVDPSSLTWEWSDAAGFASAIVAARPGVNLALQVGHNAVRSAVLAHENRPPTDDELARMRAIVREAAAQGVVGFSTGLTYPPGLFADSAEVVELVREAAGADLLYSTHVRNETYHVLQAVTEAIDTATAAGARLQVSHLKSMGRRNHGLAHQALDLVVAARAGGLDVACDVYPYTASSTSLASRLPAWALAGGAPAVAARLADPQARARMIDGLNERFHRDIEPEGIVLAEIGPGPFRDSAGRSISEIAAATGSDPASVVLAVLAAHGDVAIVNHSMAESDVRTVLAHRLSAIASDGWVLEAQGPGKPHPRSFGTFTRVMRRYVPDVITLEDAVRKATSWPASRVRLTDRGELRPGLLADIAVFDPDAIRDLATYDEPWRLSVGVSHVLVAGQFAVDGGEVTGVRAGTVVRPGGAGTAGI